MAVDGKSRQAVEGGMKTGYGIRQGDVALLMVDSATSGQRRLRLRPRDSGRAILEYGEVSGHAHAVADRTAEVYDILNEVSAIVGQMLVVSDDTPKVHALLVEKGDQTAYSPLYERERLVNAGFVIVREETVPGVILTHEEHINWVLPPGQYVRCYQVEYDGEEERRVAD